VDRTLQVGGQETALPLFGPRDTYLKRLRDAFGVQLVARAGKVTINGEPEDVRRCEAALLDMERNLNRGEPITPDTVERTVQRHLSGPGEAEEEGFELWPGLRPRTPGQAAYVRAMLESDVVFCIGPAGTGKTYLGVAVALRHLEQGDLRRIVLCRPAVEAGENLGFLPGDMYAKVNPYLRPLYDALHDLLDARKMQRYIENDLIEVLPLAFVRGRTLDNAFIILDEAQNCTVAQMKTFLSRLGPNARLLVTGDVTQIDLPLAQQSGLVDAQERLRDVPGIRFIWLTDRDIVRHPLVRRILVAYRQESLTDPTDRQEEREHAEPE